MTLQLQSLSNISMAISMQKPQKKLVKKTVIPVRIEDNTKELRGLIRFSTQAYMSKLHPLSSDVHYKKNQVLYKNQILRQQQGEEQQKKKKEIEVYEVSINPIKMKNQNFKVEIPIVRGPKSIKNSKANDLYFTFCFSNSEGKLALQNGFFEAKMQIANRSRKQLSVRDKIQLQMARLDNRRKQEVDESKYRKDEVVQSQDDN